MRKSIRKLFGIILASLLLLSMAGCAQKPNHVIRCYLIQDGRQYYRPVKLNVDGNGNGLLPDMWLDGYPSFEDETAAATKTVTYNGVEFSAKYLYSRCVSPTSFYKDFYMAKAEGAGRMWFYYNGVTDELIGMFPYSLDTFQTAEAALPEINASEETLAEIARQYAADYVDIDDYTLVDSYVRQINKDEGLVGYRYTFSRMINGQESMDCVELEISPKGQLSELILGDIGIFTQEHEETLAVFADADIDDLIADTIPEDSTLYIEEIEHLRYAVTPEGQAVLEASLHLLDHADEEFSTHVTMIFTVESN